MSTMTDYCHPGHLLPSMALRLLGPRLTECATILDIGGGSGIVGHGVWSALGISSVTIVDAWPGYAARGDWKGRKGVKLVTARGTEALGLFGPHSFDIVQCCECIEHMPHEEGEQLLEHMRLIARHLVIGTCPNGYQHQDPDHEDAAQLEWRVNPHQLHVCGWTADEFIAAGYQIAGNPTLGAGCQLLPHLVIPRE